MPSKSKAQQRFFGMIYGAKKNHKEDSLSGKAKEVADKLTKKQTKDFAETDTEDLPERKREKEERSYNRKTAAQLIKEANYWFSR